MMRVLFLFLLGSEFMFAICSALDEYTLIALNSDTPPTSPNSPDPGYHTALRLAIEDINNNPNILPETTLILENHAYQGSRSTAVAKMIEFGNNNVSLTIGNPFSYVSVLTGVVGDVYGIAQLSTSATSSALSDKLKYPLYSRMSPPSFGQVYSVIASIQYYSDIQGRGWTDVALLSTTDEYGIDSSEIFISSAKDEGIDILVYQQYLEDGLSFDVELNEIKKSGARVIVALVLGGWDLMFPRANELGLVGDSFVWFVPDSITSVSFEDNVELALLSRGVLGCFQFIPSDTELIKDFNTRWFLLDPLDYFGSDSPPRPYTLQAYDLVITAALAIDALNTDGMLTEEPIPAKLIAEAIRKVNYEGLTGKVSFDEFGDRFASFNLLYYSPDTFEWIPTALYNEEDGYELVADVVWNSNTTEIPDLDIREPFHYWSCHSKERKYDETGKSVNLQSPGSSDIDNIKSSYYCDNFIDCENFSDESVDCSSNFLAVFIAFGIITGILICITFALLVFVILFGFVLKYRRLRVASPLFLIIMLLSILLGYFSVYAWFGKPHPVACGFQPWLLGIAAISMISALCTKTFRIWRIFRNRMKKEVITDFELLGIWSLSLLPVLVILVVWTIVSTPTASLEDRDGKDHYVCATGGFTGAPGGLIFFCILIVYGSFVLLCGAVLSILVRKVPSSFNESKLLAISIYNLGFLSVVVIPVFMVVKEINPFLAWIIRTCAILYAFTATLVLQFLPSVVGIFIVDKGKNVKQFKSNISTPSSFGSTNTSAATVN